MHILPRSTAYCATCDSHACSHACSHAQASGTTPWLRAASAAVLTSLTLTLAAVFGGATADATPNYGHVSGDGQPGRVVAAAEHSRACHGGPRLVVRNSAAEPDAKRRSGPPGTFAACVTQEAYASHPVGTWFNSRSGTVGTVG